MTAVQVRYTGDHTSREELRADLVAAGAVVSPVEVDRSFETIVESFVVSLSAGVTIEIVKAVVARHRTRRPTNRIDLAKTD